VEHLLGKFADYPKSVIERASCRDALNAAAEFVTTQIARPTNVVQRPKELDVARLIREYADGCSAVAARVSCRQALAHRGTASSQKDIGAYDQTQMKMSNLVRLSRLNLSLINRSGSPIFFARPIFPAIDEHPG